MAFTGDTVHGWRIAVMKDGRRPVHGTGFAAWVDEPVVELVKGHRHIRAKGQQGIDPDILLGRAVTAALRDDIRAADAELDYVQAQRLTATLVGHERLRKIRENGWAARRVLTKGAVFHAGTAGAKGVPGGGHE